MIRLRSCGAFAARRGRQVNAFTSRRSRGGARRLSCWDWCAERFRWLLSDHDDLVLVDLDPLHLDPGRDSRTQCAPNVLLSKGAGTAGHVAAYQAMVIAIIVPS